MTPRRPTKRATTTGATRKVAAGETSGQTDPQIAAETPTALRAPGTGARTLESAGGVPRPGRSKQTANVPAIAGQLIVPALRGQMGAWTYYVATVPLRDIGRRVRYAHEVHPATRLRDLIQRTLTNRSRDIAAYLREQTNDRFFNSLVIGVYGGEPQFFEVEIRENPYLDPDDLPPTVEGALGILVMTGQEEFYAMDGQHRVAGIRQAIAEDPTIGDDVVSAVFVTYRKDDEGKERTRRLFTTLNRYAKPITKRDGIALDEDDVVAILTRDLVDYYPLFADTKVSTKHTKALPARDQGSVTTIVALYDAMDTLFRPTRPRWARYKRKRPPDETIRSYYEVARGFWDRVRAEVPALEEATIHPASDAISGRYRNADGGHLLFRPIGPRLFVRVVLALEAQGFSRDDAIARAARVPLGLGAEPWSGLLWNPLRRTMITAKENQDIAFRLWVFGAGGALEPLARDEASLRAELADLLQRDARSIVVRRYVQPAAQPGVPNTTATKAAKKRPI